jgi:hypothetical protein
MIPIRLHAAIDYAFAAALLAAAAVAVPDDAPPARAVLVVAAVFSVLYSLMTDYPLAVSRVIPFRVHLVLDAIVGAGLLLSPWLLGFAGTVASPHLLFGLAALGVTALSLGRRPAP